MKIRNKINIIFLVSFIVIISITLTFIGIYIVGFIKNEVYSDLVVRNNNKAEHIRTFIRDQETESLILAAASVYRDFLKEPVGSKNYNILKDKVYNRLIRTIEADPRVYEALVLDKNGKIVASSDKQYEGLDKSTDLFFTEAKNGVYLKDIYFSETIKKINYTLSAPINDENGALLGVSVLRYLPDDFFSIVSSEHKKTDTTEEDFLINKDLALISPSRFLGVDAILKTKINTTNAKACYDPKEIDDIKKNGYKELDLKNISTQIVEAKDYRGIDVMGTNNYIPETGWCLISKIDRSELLSFRPFLIVIFIITSIIAEIIFLLIGYFISKKITDPISVLTDVVKKIKSGGFNYKSNIKTKDEIGVLSQTFDEMIDAVSESRKDIERKVEEQTREILNKTNDLENQKSAILNILEDVKKEKDKSELLASDLEKFKLAVENVSDQIVITDPEGIVVYGNRAVEIITGFKPEEAIGKKAGVLWKMPMPDEYYKNLWDTIKNKKKVFVDDIQNKRKNGDLYIANISISPVLNDKNDIIYFVAIEHDITKEKEIDKAKTEFVSLASHQLRTPLSSINWYTEMLLAGDAGKINKEQKKYLNEVAVGNKRMVDLVDSLLNVSRLDLGTFIIEPQPTNVTEMVKSVINELKPQIIEKKLKFEEFYQEKMDDYLADQKLLRMVFQNLLSNAVKYTKDEGLVKIEIKITQKGGVFGEKEIKEDSLVIKISDSGIGVPENQKDKIFSKMFRADNARESETEGTGLGLYIIKSIIDNSGGWIWFESKENEGTTFYISLPFSGMKKKDGLKKLD